MHGRTLSSQFQGHSHANEPRSEIRTHSARETPLELLVEIEAIALPVR